MWFLGICVRYNDIFAVSDRQHSPYPVREEQGVDLRIGVPRATVIDTWRLGNDYGGGIASYCHLDGIVMWVDY